jgi:hypothetical protein
VVVGGAEASPNGFSNLRPHISTEMSTLINQSIPSIYPIKHYQLEYEKVAILAHFVFDFRTMIANIDECAKQPSSHHSLIPSFFEYLFK